MIALDTSVLVAALVPNQAYSKESGELLHGEKVAVSAYALVETFSTLTGGKLSVRLSPDDATELIRSRVLSVAKTIEFKSDDLIAAFTEAKARGVRGGAIYDYLHLVAARKAPAMTLFTLNFKDFKSFRRPGDPEIHHP